MKGGGHRKIPNQAFGQEFWTGVASRSVYNAHMSTIELSRFTLREKLQIMQSIWEDLRSHVDRFEVPQSHKDILDERRRRVESGEAKLRDWDQVKYTIGKR